MILFPYAKDVEYKDKKLSFTLNFFNAENETQIAINMDIDDELADIIEKLLMANNEV